MRLVSSPLAQLQDQNTSGTVALTGASPVTGHGLDVAASTGRAVTDLSDGSLCAQVSWNIKATSLTYTAFWEVATLAAPSTWIKVVDANDAAQTAFATGTGSDVAGGPLVFSAPACAMAFPHVRLSVVTGGSATGVAGHDNVTIKYAYRVKDQISE